jgi:5-methylcytosine-specific restriction protein A
VPKPPDRRQRNREYDRQRRSERPWRAWYSTARWQAIRSAQLSANPLCSLCEKRGRVTPATVCNHVERHNGDPAKFWNGPFNSMCSDCHDVDQQRIERGGRARQSVDGDGWPIEVLTGE